MSPIPTAVVVYPWWPLVGAPLANHLWQSTLFVGVAGLVALLLKKKSARIRYFVWFLASIKVLIPFSLLVAVGDHIAWSSPSVNETRETFVTIRSISEPFGSGKSIHLDTHPSAVNNSSAVESLPIAILVVWCCGFFSTVFYWCFRLRKISCGLVGSERVTAGRECELMHRLEHRIGLRQHVNLILSKCALEPGILGILHPVLVLPSGISDRLSDAQLEAVLTHELCHVYRRDNLSAAIHMLVEAIFWFYPIVWWIGARLVDERERACDQEVLHFGNARQVYAESILKICEFSLEFPMFCKLSVSGSNLKMRIEAIMIGHAPLKLSLTERLLLATAGLLALVVPIAYGLLIAAPSRAQSPEPNATSVPVLTNVYVRQNNSGSKFSSMNVPLGYGDIFPDTRGAFSGVNVPLVSYIVFAYDLTGSQLQLLLPQLPKWTIQDHFDVQAQSSGNLTREQMRLVVQSLLSDRFKLTTHYESRQLPVFALVMANPRVTGPRLRQHADNPPCLPPPTGPDWVSSLRSIPTSGEGFPSVCGGIVGLPSEEPDRMRVGARRVPIELFANTLPQIGNLNRPVVDQTGLAGTFDFVFDWTPQLNDESKPRFLEDLKQQLGLELQSEVGEAKVFVVDHVEKPSEN